MPWPSLWPFTGKKDDTKDQSIINTAQNAVKDVTKALHNDNNTNNNTTSTTTIPTLQSFTQPQTILATIILTTTTLTIFKFYRKYLRRITQATNIPKSYLRQRSIFGKVTSVGDGDNFRIYHTPGGWLAGWGWLPWRRVPSDRKALKDKTIHVRLAGIDAPEMAHFGRPAQPYSQDALDWLTRYVSGRRVRVHVHRPDQYGRVVGTAYLWKGVLRRDVGLQMLKVGLATVYEAKTGVEFGGDGLEKTYRDAEYWAKMKRRGMWAGKEQDYESPREYKSKYAGQGDGKNKV